MTIFDFLSSILFTKNKIAISTIDSENEFSPFLVNRWISMYSSSCAKNSNILNKFTGCLSKAEFYSLCIAVFDKVANKKINYFKKKRDEEKNNKEDLILKISAAKELSTREIKEYFKLLNYNIQ